MGIGIAQICLNGDIISGDIENETQPLSKYCHHCGAETITACPDCNAPIQGSRSWEGTLLFAPMSGAPNYCPECGKPYPWTAASLEALQAIIDEEFDLSDNDKENLKKSLPDLINETPRSDLAISRVKRAFLSVAETSKTSFINTLTKIACDAILLKLGITA